jgi:hypothetical protein
MYAMDQIAMNSMMPPIAMGTEVLLYSPVARLTLSQKVANSDPNLQRPAKRSRGTD